MKKIILWLFLTAFISVSSASAKIDGNPPVDGKEINEQAESARQRVDARHHWLRNWVCGILDGKVPVLPYWCFDDEPEPEEELTDHLLITEVYYDTDLSHGNDANNEWVEIHNNTGSDVNLSGWKIADASLEDVLPDIDLPHSSFAIITRNDSTSPFWSWPAETVVIILGSQIGNGLGNGGDVVYLKDSSGNIVDSVSWGANTDAFDPSVIDVADGHSISRKDLLTDTDTADNWQDLEIPNPGTI